MSTPPDTSQTNTHVDEVVESLERAFTLLKRRTRDVLKLAYEREELMAAIENREARVAPATLEPGHGTAIHGESAAPAPTDVVTTATEPEQHHDLDESPDVIDAESISDRAEPAVAETTAPESIAAAPNDQMEQESSTPPTADVMPDAEASVEPAIPEIDDAQAPDTPVAEQPPVSEVVADTDDSGFMSKWGTPAPEIHEEATVEALTETDWAESEDTPAPAASERDEWAAGPDIADVADAAAEESSSLRPWEEPDLEWSDDDSDVAPHAFPHPMPPVDASVVETPSHDFDAIDDSPHAADDAGWETPEDEVSFSTEAPETTGDFDDSPFAAEFEEHVEEVGGSLEASPFDLDTPPQPASYRPRSLQGDRSSDAMTASGLLEAGDEPDARSGEIENVEAAWDDFAGDQSSAPVPEPGLDRDLSQEPPERVEPAPSSGSRLRDLVAKAQEAERARTEQEQSDFDLINEDATVSRYDKNSAKLPTVGISSEELSSSVASLRSSFTSDKKSGSSSRNDDTGPSRADKRAEKRAAKEAAKAAKAEAKRSRKEGT